MAAGCRTRRSHLPAEPVVVDADPRRLDRILGNLLDNAREHAPRARRSRSARPRRRRDAVIVVADRGPGVPHDALAHLFDRFYKADPSRHGGSSGLGLAIAAEHAALLGGGLRAANRAGRRPAVALRAAGDRIVTRGDGRRSACDRRLRSRSVRTRESSP